MNEKKSSSWNKFFSVLRDTVELYYPALCLIILFLSFLIGIFSRYILKNPQSWTYELSTISFVNMVIGSWPFVQRKHGHIVFDMFYERQSDKVKRAMRITGNLLIAISAAALLPATYRYLHDMKNLTTQVIHMPRWLVFSCFAVSLFLCMSHAVLDIIEDLRKGANVA